MNDTLGYATAQNAANSTSRPPSAVNNILDTIYSRNSRLHELALTLALIADRATGPRLEKDNGQKMAHLSTPPNSLMQRLQGLDQLLMARCEELERAVTVLDTTI